MIGEGLLRLARRVLRAHTCRAIVEPAIADLQHEGARGRLWRLRGYVGVCRAVAAALADQIVEDTSLAIGAMAAPAALRPALLTAGIVALAAFSPVLWRPELFQASRWVLWPLLAVGVVPIAALPALTVAARAAARTTRSTRGYTYAAMIVATLLLLYVDQGVTRTNRMFRDIEGRARGIEHPLPGARELSLAELRDPETHWRGHENAFAREGPQRIAFAASAIGYVLMGVATAPLRTWLVPVVVLLMSVLHYALIVGAFLVSNRRPGLTVMVSLSPTVALIVAAAIATKYSRGVLRP